MYGKENVDHKWFPLIFLGVVIYPIKPKQFLFSEKKNQNNLKSKKMIEHI